MKQDFIVKFSTTTDRQFRVAVLATNPPGDAHAIESPMLDPFDADPEQAKRFALGVLPRVEERKEQSQRLEHDRLKPRVRLLKRRRAGLCREIGKSNRDRDRPKGFESVLHESRVDILRHVAHPPFKKFPIG